MWIDRSSSANLQCSYVTPVIRLEYMPSCTSAGDIVRELDSSSILTGDHFVLVGAGVISNIDLAPIWKEHVNRWNKSTYNCMTSVFTHIPYVKTERSRDLSIILDKEDRILAYDDLKEKTAFSVLTSSLLEAECVCRVMTMTMTMTMTMMIYNCIIHNV